jgi:Cu(I)/Ag(I) efflux system membrane protein CusA/SilA
VLLAVPFALTGGIYLLWALGYNFSVAVWVGFIALFGTAVQTGVVMVIYLEEAVERKRRELDGVLTREALRQAVMEGALLRLRPKVMTVSTVVAGLLPIMWSTSVGAEVMKPLATPVLGGMVSSLIHVLIVTPVIFLWIHERRLGLLAEPLPAGRRLAPSRRQVIGAAAILIAGAACGLLWKSRWGTDTAPARLAATVIRSLRSRDVDVVLLSPGGSLRQGRNQFFIEFRRAGTTSLVDVSHVRASGNMPMPGMVMSGGLEVHPTDVPGRFTATAQFGMAGAWRMAIDWDGPTGPGSVRFEGGVQ